MNTNKLSFVAAAVLYLPLVAYAQTAASGSESSSWGNLFWGIFPIIVLVLIFIPLIRRMQRPIMTRTQQHMERQVQHMERVEQSLERILRALERRDSSAKATPADGGIASASESGSAVRRR